MTQGHSKDDVFLSTFSEFACSERPVISEWPSIRQLCCRKIAVPAGSGRCYTQLKQQQQRQEVAERTALANMLFSVKFHDEIVQISETQAVAITWEDALGFISSVHVQITSASALQAPSGRRIDLNRHWPTMTLDRQWTAHPMNILSVYFIYDQKSVKPNLANRSLKVAMAGVMAFSAKNR
jgi:hypothetical protein